MIILGDRLIPYETITKVDLIEQIATTQPNSTLLFSYNTELLNYCFENQLNCAVQVNSVKEAIYANSLKATYIICDLDIAPTLQALADHYMYDAKVLTIIDSNNEFENIAKLGIDGVIYSTLL